LVPQFLNHQKNNRTALDAPTATASQIAQAISSLSEPIVPIPVDIGLDADKVMLGKRLFQDVRLSHDHSISCASCHDLATGGDSNQRYSTGIRGQKGIINAPTVFNSGLNSSQFWDGRAKSLEDQIEGPITSPIEMGSTWDEVLGRIRNDPLYRESFDKLYADGVTKENVANAIATFERSLNTPNSRFDQYLKGDKSVITEDELKGYVLFKNYGCISCHQGANGGGNMYQKFGIFDDYFVYRGGVTQVDYGRYNITGVAEHRFQFKVPGLRNVALTAPYFHDGSAPTLSDAIEIMGRFQLGLDLPNDDVALIEKFLHTLTGPYEGGSL